RCERYCHVAGLPSKSVDALIRLRQPRERVDYPDASLGVVPRLQNSAHEDSHASAPDSRLEKITGDAPRADVGNAELHRVELQSAEHCLRILDPIARFMA